MGQATKEWLDGLKVGDRVAIVHRDHNSTGRIASVTPAYVNVGNVDYRRKNGERKGNGAYDFDRIEPVTTAVLQEVATRVNINQISAAMADPCNLTLDQLRRIRSIIGEPKTTEGQDSE